MDNPHELFGVSAEEFNPGAIFKSPDENAPHYNEVGYGSQPFDWDLGYDIELEMGVATKTSGFKLPIKNQGQSGSCGGQAESYLGESIGALNLKSFEEKSAKFTYAPVAAPGGGSSGDELANRSENVGWGSEALTPSYQNGQPPTEAFMEQVQDITPDATQHASIDRAISNALVNVDIDSIAQAVRDNGGVRIGIAGSNNGTWLSEFPQHPNTGDTLWYHWVDICKAQMINGKKMIGFPNSWGTAAGNQGWQWLDENYVNTTYIFEARTYVFNDTPPPAEFHYRFMNDLQVGSTGPDVIALQTALQIDGEFPLNIKPTGYYGNVTKAAVTQFQKRYGIDQVGVVGPRTLAELNSLFSN